MVAARADFCWRQKKNLLGNTVRNRMCASVSWICGIKASVLQEVTSCRVESKRKSDVFLVIQLTA